MLSMLNSIKVLVSKNDTYAYREACVKRTIITAIKCIFTNRRCLNSIII